jgi:hypothetical protein
MIARAIADRLELGLSFPDIAVGLVYIEYKSQTYGGNDDSRTLKVLRRRPLRGSVPHRVPTSSCCDPRHEWSGAFGGAPEPQIDALDHAIRRGRPKKMRRKVRARPR